MQKPVKKWKNNCNERKNCLSNSFRIKGMSSKDKSNSLKTTQGSKIKITRKNSTNSCNFKRSIGNFKRLCHVFRKLILFAWSWVKRTFCMSLRLSLRFKKMAAEYLELLSESTLTVRTKRSTVSLHVLRLQTRSI